MKMIYLAGPINGRSDDDCKGWRERASSVLGDAAVDPMRRDYRGIEDANWKAIVEDDKRDIDGCNWVLVYFDAPSVGTSMEVLYAWERDIPVVVINRSVKPLSPWLRYHAFKIVDSLEDALRLVTEG